MKKFIAIVGVALIATLTANAGLVTSWSDDFNGADGAVVAPGAKWGYTNMGVIAGVWSNPIIPRLDADDQHYITNNTLFCYTGPATNNPAVYNKVMSTIYPKTDGTPVHVDLTTGILEVEWDLVNMVQNDGNMWGLGQEMKISISPEPVMQDPGDDVTNLYMVTMGIRPDSNGNYYLNNTAKQAGGGNGNIIANTGDILTPVAPVTFKMVLKSDTSFMCYTNGALFGMTNSALPAFEDVYIQVWHGMFNGGGGVVSDGNIELDNFSVDWAIPEPSFLLLGLLAIPLWKRFRK